MKFNFPVGYQNFHQNNLLNFQLNRWYSSGLLQLTELTEIAKRISSFSEAKAVFKEFADRALANGNYIGGATFLRAAEFFALGNDPDKQNLYQACITAYNRAYADEPIINEKVAYQHGYLPVMRLMTTQNSKGWVILHGGYDSFIQELYPLTQVFTDSGFDVLMFEGPGQGGALNNYGLTLTHEWEKPVAAVLDHYQITDAALVGISLGGYLAARAAAYDQRISQVILYDIIFDFYQALMSKASPQTRSQIEHNLDCEDHSFWSKLEQQISKNLFAKWLILQGYHVFGVDSLPKYYQETKKYATRHISQYITQDVLLLAGEEDIYTPFMASQQQALINAKSVTCRVFTAEENASHHCQVGNLMLALSYIIEWIDSKK